MNEILELLSLDVHPLGLIALAGGLGALIGLEREIADKPAGLRTHIFVCSGSALLMLLGDAILERFSQQQSQIVINSDPIRVIQAIVIGISFLGAGTIIHQGGCRVEGLTTAASIFFTAGVGVAVAIERFGLAAGATVFAVLVLLVIGWLEKLLHRVVGGKKGEEELPPKDASAQSRAPRTRD